MSQGRRDPPAGNPVNPAILSVVLFAFPVGSASTCVCGNFCEVIVASPVTMTVEGPSLTLGMTTNPIA
jgi:hypothetical protein